MPTIKSVLAEAISLLQASSESPSLDAEVLLCKALGRERIYLRAWDDAELSLSELQAYQALVNDRNQGVPIAYLTGNREFWSRDFLVSPDVLIPRPDTELLIELSLALTPQNQPYKIMDLGTGSGIIAVTLAAERPHAKISAIDISLAALQIAQANATRHKTEHIQFYQSNWFADVPNGRYDLIVSNPPYLAEKDDHLTQGDLRFEPKIALISGTTGLGDISAIAEAALKRLTIGGYLLVEHGYNQQESVQNIFLALGYHKVQTHCDLSGLPRVTSGQHQSLT